MAHLSVSWPSDGSKNWGAQVDTNLNAIVAQVNQHDDTLATIGSTSTGPQGPIGPIAIRFYTASGWPDREVGTEAHPIINISSAFPGAPSPTSPVEGDLWIP